MASLDKLIEDISVWFRNNLISLHLRTSSRNECAARLLADVRHPEHYFKLANGVELKSLCDLAEILPEMDDATFSLHVNEEKNDFSNWLRDIVGDAKLAGKLLELKTKDEHANAVNIRVNYFKQMMR